MYSDIRITEFEENRNIVKQCSVSHSLTLENLVLQYTSETKVIESKWRTITLKDY